MAGNATRNGSAKPPNAGGLRCVALPVVRFCRRFSALTSCAHFALNTLIAVVSLSEALQVWNC